MPPTKMTDALGGKPPECLVNAKTLGCAREGEAPAEPRAKGHVDVREGLGRSLALPREANPRISL